MVTTRQSTKASVDKKSPNNGDGFNNSTHNKLPSEDRVEKEALGEENEHFHGKNEQEIAHILLATRAGLKLTGLEPDNDDTQEDSLKDNYEEKCNVVLKNKKF